MSPQTSVLANCIRDVMSTPTLSTKRQFKRQRACNVERRIKLWEPVRNKLRIFLKRGGKGTASAIAFKLDVHPSHIHRYSCPVCEHDTEPQYSLGIALKQIIEQWGANPKAFTYLWRKQKPKSKVIRESYRSNSTSKQLKLEDGKLLPSKISREKSVTT